MIVVDASALIDLLLQREGADVIDRRLSAGSELAAPHLIDLEVLHVMRRLRASGLVTEADVQRALGDLSAFPLKRYPHLDLTPRVWELRGQMSAYDAIYVALAEALDAPLITRDSRLGAAAGHSAIIEVV